MIETMKDISLDQFKELLYSLDNKTRVIIKFTASWCGPCKKIQPVVEELLNTLPKNIIFIEIDIDESLELYILLKKYKQVNGIPATLVYNTRNKDDDKWYISNDSVLGGDIEAIKQLFNKTIASTIE
jgi:thioredoxin 1